MNLIEITGRLTRDPESHLTSNGTMTSSYGLAVRSGYDSQSKQEECFFIDCTSFGKQAEYMNKYPHKGDLIAVVGRLVQNKFMRKDGTEVKRLEVIATSVETLIRKVPNGESEGEYEQKGAPTQARENREKRQAYENAMQAQAPVSNMPKLDDDDLPF